MDNTTTREKLILAAADMVGDLDDPNEEYLRGMVELIVETTTTPKQQRADLGTGEIHDDVRNAILAVGRALA